MKNQYQFRSHHFHFRPTTMTDAFRRAFDADVGKPMFVREAKILVPESKGSNKRSVIAPSVRVYDRRNGTIKVVECRA